MSTRKPSPTGRCAGSSTRRNDRGRCAAGDRSPRALNWAAVCWREIRELRKRNEASIAADLILTGHAPASHPEGPLGPIGHVARRSRRLPVPSGGSGLLRRVFPSRLAVPRLDIHDGPNRAATPNLRILCSAFFKPDFRPSHGWSDRDPCGSPPPRSEDVAEACFPSSRKPAARS